jgi:hypothetical protein
MPLTFPDGARFATGATAYRYRPATSHETTPRLILEVEIEGIRTEAIVDTGGVYLFCHPTIARLLSLTPAEALRGCPETSQPRCEAFKPLSDAIGKQDQLAVQACAAEDDGDAVASSRRSMLACAHRLSCASDPDRSRPWGVLPPSVAARA